jgi:antitoxin VapB
MATAKVFKSGNSQAIRLPKEFRLKVSEVELVRQGDDIVIRQPKKVTLMDAYNALAGIADDFFKDGRNDPPPEERLRAGEHAVHARHGYLCFHYEAETPKSNKPVSKPSCRRSCHVGWSPTESFASAPKRATAIPRPEALEVYPRSVPVMPMDRSRPEHYSQDPARLGAAKGQIIGNNDLWIASHCLQLGLTLVTNNEREFSRIPNLTIENWTH